MATLMCFFVLGLFAQDFQDDMEYNPGDPFGPWWYDCPINCPEIVDGFANTGNKSAIVMADGISEIDLDLGLNTEGIFELDFYMYIAEGREAYFGILEDITLINGGSGSFIANIHFNRDLLSPAVGEIEEFSVPTGNSTSFSYPVLNWFKVDIRVVMDPAGDTWGFKIDGVQVLADGTPLRNSDGDELESYGGISFFSVSTDAEWYLDSFNFDASPLLGVSSEELAAFKIYPNPTSGVLNISSERLITSISVYTVEGKVVNAEVSEERIDVSQLASGIYFIEVATSIGKNVSQFIKE